MSKPQIIGYETDPNATREQLDNASQWSIYIGSEGMWLQECMSPHETVWMTDDNVTDVYRSIGYRPIYKPRDFHARWTRSGYIMKCRTCGATSPIIERSANLQEIAASHAETWHGSYRSL